MVKITGATTVVAAALAVTTEAATRPSKVQVEEWSLPQDAPTECEQALPATGVVFETYDKFIDALKNGLDQCDPAIGALRFNLRYVWTAEEVRGSYIDTCPDDSARPKALELQWYFDEPLFELESMFAMRVKGSCDLTQGAPELNLSAQKCDAPLDSDADMVPCTGIPVSADETGFVPSPVVAAGSGTTATFDLELCSTIDELAINTYNLAYGTAGDESSSTTEDSTSSMIARPTNPPDVITSTEAKAAPARLATVTASVSLAAAMVVGQAF